MPPKSGTAALASKAPLSICFTGSGFLAVYQLGAVQCLLDVAPGVVEGAPKVFGASAGSLVAAAVVCGTNMGCMRDEVMRFARVVRRHTLGALSPSADLFRSLQRVLRRIVPENAHLLANGRLHVAATRVPDGEPAFLSEFQSREDVIQYYVDGAFTSNALLQYDHRALTVSPFAGDMDICPRDQLEWPYDVVVGGLAFQMSILNLFRMIDTLFPPACTVLHKAYHSGYEDAHFFLQRSGRGSVFTEMAQAFFHIPRSIGVSFPGRKVGHKMRTDLIEYQPSLKSLPPSAKARSGSIMESHMLREEEEEKEAEEEEEEEEEDEDEEGEVPAAVSEEKAGITGHGSRSPGSSAWSLSSLEQALYLSLPGCVQAALLCNLMARMGLVGFQDSFPARLISYLLLPYTLPACIFFHFAHRLLLRLRHIPGQAFWLWQDVKQIWLFFCRTTASSVRKNLADRNVLGHLRVLSARFLPSIHLSPALEFLSEDEVPTETARVRRRSTLRLQLCGLSSSESRAQPCPDGLAFSLQLDLGLEMDSQPDALALPPCQPPPPLEFHPSSEGEDEIASSLSAAQMPAGGEGEGEGGARERRTQQPAAVHG